MKYFVMLKLFETDSGAITCFKLGLRLDRSTARNPDILAIIDRTSTDKYGQVRTSTARLDYIRLDKTNTGDESPEGKVKKEAGFQAMALANLLNDLHLKIDSGYNATEKQLQQWGADIEKINRLDGRDYVQIDSVIRWAKSDEFWKTNIMSGKKLREKFPVLVAKMPKRVYDEGLKEVVVPDEFDELLERSR